MQANEMEGAKILSGMEDYIFYCDLVHVSDDAYYEGALAFRQIHARLPRHAVHPEPAGPRGLDQPRA